MKTLTDIEITANKNEFLDLIRSINIEGANIEGLVEFLEQSDFFEAPASTKYHLACRGGLCQHSLNVYSELVKLYNHYKGLREDLNYTEDTLKIVGLLHDLSKTGYYETYVMNKKVYFEQGTKKDALGKFDWISEEAYKVKEPEERYLGADHGTNSAMLINRFIPLLEEEFFAIVNHHLGFDNAFCNKDLSFICNKYPLVSLIHLADWGACYILEAI